MKMSLAIWRRVWFELIEDREGPADPQVKLTQKQKTERTTDNERIDCARTEEADGPDTDGQ